MIQGIMEIIVSGIFLYSVYWITKLIELSYSTRKINKNYVTLWHYGYNSSIMLKRCLTVQEIKNEVKDFLHSIDKDFYISKNMIISKHENFSDFNYDKINEINFTQLMREFYFYKMTNKCENKHNIIIDNFLPAIFCYLDHVDFRSRNKIIDILINVFEIEKKVVVYFNET